MEQRVPAQLRPQTSQPPVWLAAATHTSRTAQRGPGHHLPEVSIRTCKRTPAPPHQHTDAIGRGQACARAEPLSRVLPGRSPPLSLLTHTSNCPIIPPPPGFQARLRSRGLLCSGLLPAPEESVT